MTTWSLSDLTRRRRWRMERFSLRTRRGRKRREIEKSKI